MSVSAPTWSIRSLLSPVVTRLLIHGVDPFDLERVLSHVESIPMRNARQLETTWVDDWEALANTWEQRAEAAAARGGRLSARDLGLCAVSCRLAQFLVNPGSIERRRAIYAAYAKSYRTACANFASRVLKVELPLGAKGALSALLHLPEGEGPHPSALVLAGLGSCKEEMHTLARYLVERGVAALVPDMPGCGETLFEHGVSCGSENFSAAFEALTAFATQHPALNSERVGALGLCMGGGYAYRACAEQSRLRWCAALFPLFIDRVEDGKTPQWMKKGEWLELQIGGKDEQTLFREIGWRDSLRIRCPFYLAHGRHDNWMTLEQAERLFEHAESEEREMLVVEDVPAYSAENAVTHTMPVGEQLRWVGPLVADWIAEQSTREHAP